MQCVQSGCCARNTGRLLPMSLWPFLGSAASHWAPSLQRDLCPPPAPGKIHILVNLVTPCNSSSEAREPRFLPGSAPPLETFQPRHVAAQSSERNFISPTSLLQHTDRQYIDKSSGKRNQTALDPIWIKKPQTGDPKSEVSEYKSFVLIEHIGRHGRSNTTIRGGRSWWACREGGTSSGSGAPLSYSHQLALYA